MRGCTHDLAGGIVLGVYMLGVISNRRAFIQHDVIIEWFLETHLLYKIDNILFQLVIVSNTLTMIMGSWLSETIQLIHYVRRACTPRVGSDPS